MNLPTSNQLLPIALASSMLYLGMTLQMNDFKRVLKRRRALAGGLAGQLLRVPALGWLVASMTRLDPVSWRWA